jgi:hypothetical protein
MVGSDKKEGCPYAIELVTHLLDEFTEPTLGPQTYVT